LPSAAVNLRMKRRGVRETIVAMSGDTAAARRCAQSRQSKSWDARGEDDSQEDRRKHKLVQH
jgi:hypothetical protein